MRSILVILALLFAFTNAIGQTTVPTAEEILAPAYKKAAAESKKVFIIFHASWCGWCKKMDASMNDPLVNKYFTDNYVTVHLTVEESAKNKQLENPGAWEIKKQYNGEKAGLPFWLIMDEARNLIADSYIRPAGTPLTVPGQSIGCPASEEEVKAFITALKQTSKLDAHALKVIEERFKKNKAG